jgi:hypothetical protein
MMATALIFFCIPKDVQPLHRSQEGHRQAGLWLAEHLHYNNDVLVDPYNWASFYAGLAFVKKSSNTDPRYSMGVIDPKDNDLYRQRDWKGAKLFEKRAKTVWCWPDPGQPKLIIRQVQMNGLSNTFTY